MYVSSDFRKQFAEGSRDWENEFEADMVLYQTDMLAPRVFS
jgi:hypothetical protein